MNNKLPNVVQLIIATLRLSVTAPDITDRFAAAGEVDWPALLGYADEHGLTSALYEAYKRAGVLPYVPPAALARMTQLHGENYRRQTCNRAEWLEIHRVLTEANVPHLLLNDPAFLVAPGMIRERMIDDGPTTVSRTSRAVPGLARNESSSPSMSPTRWQ